MADAAPSDHVLDQLLAWVQGQTFGSATVQQALGATDRDADEEIALFLTLTLSDPAAETWPIDDVLDLRRAVLGKAHELGLTTPIYVRLIPATDAPQADDPSVMFGN